MPVAELCRGGRVRDGEREKRERGGGEDDGSGT